MQSLGYLLISLELTSLVLSAAFFIAWRSFSRQPHALIWSVAFGVGMLHWSLNLTPGLHWLPFEVYWLCVSATAILTSSLIMIGYRTRAQRPYRWLLWAVIGGSAWLLIAVFTLIWPHEGMQGVVGVFYTAAMMGIAMRALLSPRGPKTGSEYGAAVVIGVFALSEIAAGIAILSGGATGSATADAWYLGITFLTLPAAFTGGGVFTVLILASDISREMQMLAVKDPLTGLFNRRGFSAAAEHCLSRTRRFGGSLAVIVCDLDHFKTINDRHGHAVGDEALTRVALTMEHHLGARAIVGRQGGEEFAIVLPDTALDLALDCAEALRAALARVTVAAGEASLELRASFGVAALLDSDQSMESVLRRADAALYESKNCGRDRVTAARPHAADSEASPGAAAAC